METILIIRIRFVATFGQMFSWVDKIFLIDKKMKFNIKLKLTTDWAIFVGRNRQDLKSRETNGSFITICSKSFFRGEKHNSFGLSVAYEPNPSLVEN